MLEALHLRHFQCFIAETVECAPLTLLVGENDTGKSAVIRACLALQQSFLYDGCASGLQINGPLVRLGAPEDVLCNRARTPGLDLTLKRRNDIRRYCFTCSAKGFAFSRASSLAAPFPEPLFHLGPERAAPRPIWPAPTPFEHKLNAPGAAGQFVPWLLARGEKRQAPCPPPPEDQATADGAVAPPTPVEIWLSRMFGAVRVRAWAWPGADLVGLEFFRPGRDIPNRRPRAGRADQAGSGLLAALPVVTAALNAPPHSLFFMEHPEALLSPGAEAVMGSFLAHTAAGGVQIVAETREGPLLEGVRQAVRTGVLSPADVAVNLLRRDNATDAVRVECLDLDEFRSFFLPGEPAPDVG